MSDPNDASGYSRTDLISRGFIHTPELMALVQDTRKVATIDVARFDAIVVAGGQSPMFTFERATDLHGKFAAFFEAGKVAAALCHGSAILRLRQGTAAASTSPKGRTVTGLRQRRGGLRGQRRLVLRHAAARPARDALAHRDRLQAIGANYVQAGLWRSFAVRDGNLVTGQQNFSGAETARLVIEALGR